LRRSHFWIALVQRSDGQIFLVFICSALISALAQGIPEGPKKQFSLGRMVAQPAILTTTA
jgi:hypothetical protein